MVNKIVTKFPKLEGLKNIGGHKIYHLEGDALVHTAMVCENAINDEEWFFNVCALHDIGKLYTSVCHGENNWTYPNHSTSGALHLSEFVDEEDYFFPVYKWFIENHIKPLFWKTLEDSKNLTTVPAGYEEYCSVKNIIKLAIYDVNGSISSIENPKKEELIQFYKLVKQEIL